MAYPAMVSESGGELTRDLAHAYRTFSERMARLLEVQSPPTRSLRSSRAARPSKPSCRCCVRLTEIHWHTRSEVATLTAWTAAVTACTRRRSPAPLARTARRVSGPRGPAIMPNRRIGEAGVSRMESQGCPGMVQIAETTPSDQDEFLSSPGGLINIKGRARCRCGTSSASATLASPAPTARTIALARRMR